MKGAAGAAQRPTRHLYNDLYNPLDNNDNQQHTTTLPRASNTPRPNEEKGRETYAQVCFIHKEKEKAAGAGLDLGQDEVRYWAAADCQGAVAGPYRPDLERLAGIGVGYSWWSNTLGSGPEAEEREVGERSKEVSKSLVTGSSSLLADVGQMRRGSAQTATSNSFGPRNQHVVLQLTLTSPAIRGGRPWHSGGQPDAAASAVG